MQLSISSELSRILLFAREEAARTGYASILPDHLMLGILRNREGRCCTILGDLGIVADEMKDFLDSLNTNKTPVPYTDLSKIAPSRKSEAIMNLAGFIALRHRLESVLPEHLLIAILEDGETNAAGFLSENGISKADLEQAFHLDFPDEGAVRKVTPTPPDAHFIHLGNTSKYLS